MFISYISTIQGSKVPRFLIISWTESTSTPWTLELCGSNHTHCKFRKKKKEKKKAQNAKNLATGFYQVLLTKPLLSLFSVQNTVSNALQREEETSGTNHLQSSTVQSSKIHLSIHTYHIRYHYRLVPSIPLFTARSIRYH